MSEWQPIETAPKDGSRFLASVEGRVDFFHWQELKNFPSAPIGWRNSFITVYRDGDASGPKYWMPIPTSPQD